jgi:hypothetical protein
LEFGDQQARSCEPFQPAARDIAVDPVRSRKLVGRYGLWPTSGVEERVP